MSSYNQSQVKRRKRRFRLICEQEAKNLTCTIKPKRMVRWLCRRWWWCARLRRLNFKSFAFKKSLTLIRASRKKRYVIKYVSSFRKIKILSFSSIKGALVSKCRLPHISNLLTTGNKGSKKLFLWRKIHSFKSCRQINSRVLARN